MYALGKTPIEALGTQLIFDSQGQFNESTSTAPAVGTALIGGITEVTTGAILGQLGSRDGSSPSEWRRATVVVSRDTLLSDQEMNYWNFFAQRLGDPDRTGVPSYEGYVSFDAGTQNTVDLKTEVTPKSFVGNPGAALVEVTTPEFGTRDLRDVQFDATVPSKYPVNQTTTISGTITATDRTDFSQVLVRFWKSGGTSDDAVRFWDVFVTNSGTFSMDVQFTDEQKGLYQMDVFLLWPGAGPQLRRSGVTPILVE